MQNLVIYALANGTLGSVRDYANAKQMALPSFTRGFGANIKLRLFATDDDNTPYPVEQFSSIASWQCVWDKDFTSTTTPIIFADNSQITIASVTDTINGVEYEFTEINIPVSMMNTQQIVDFLGNNEQVNGLVMELIGFDSNAQELFGLQLKGFSIRNRVYYTGTPTVIEPEYLSAAQTRALIAAGVVMQFSVNGTSWHDTQSSNDRYVRFRSASTASSEWSSAIELPEGTGSYCYVAYASNTSGYGFSMTPSESLPFVAIKTSSTAIDNPQASDFAGLWQRYLGVNGTGTPGTDGVNAYCYVAYASDSSGSNFSLTPSNTLKYRAEIHPTIAIENPSSGDFIGATWVKYIGDNGGISSTSLSDDPAIALSETASAGTSQEAARADHVHPTTGLVKQSDISNVLRNPSGGVAGQVLKKTASGVEWGSGASVVVSADLNSKTLTAADEGYVFMHTGAENGRYVKGALYRVVKSVSGDSEKCEITGTGIYSDTGSQKFARGFYRPNGTTNDGKPVYQNQSGYTIKWSNMDHSWLIRGLNTSGIGWSIILIASGSDSDTHPTSGDLVMMQGMVGTDSATLTYYPAAIQDAYVFARIGYEEKMPDVIVGGTVVVYPGNIYHVRTELQNSISVDFVPVAQGMIGVSWIFAKLYNGTIYSANTSLLVDQEIYDLEGVKYCLLKVTFFGTHAEVSLVQVYYGMYDI